MDLIIEKLSKEIRAFPLLRRYNFTPDSELQDLLNYFYFCPLCNSIKQGFAVEEILNDNGTVSRIMYLECRHAYNWYEKAGYIDIKYRPSVQAWVKLEVYDEKNRLIRKLYQKSHSFLQQFIGLLQLAMANITNGSLTITGGTAQTPEFEEVSGTTSVILNVMTAGFGASSGVSTYGIVIGTGTTANSTSTYALASQIANGTGAGQMQYGAMSISSPTASGNTISFNLSRSFTNSSGGTINVNEIGIYAKNSFQTAGTTPTTITNYFDLARDVLASTQAIANGSSLSVTYTIQITIS